VVAGTEGEDAKRRKKPNGSVDIGEEPRRDNLRPKKGEDRGLVIKRNDCRSRGPPTPAKRRPKDWGTPRILDRAPLQAYEWEPRGFVDPLPAEPISRRRPPKKNATMPRNKYFERSKTSRHVIILESKIDAPVNGCLRNIVSHFKSLVCIRVRLHRLCRKRSLKIIYFSQFDRVGLDLFLMSKKLNYMKSRG